MPEDTSIILLRERLERDDQFFQSVINAIPPKYYFDPEVLEELEEKKLKTADEEHKNLRFKAKKTFGSKAKHKRHRLNPLQQKSVTQIVEELETQESQAKVISNAKLPLSSQDKLAELQEKLKKRIQEMKAKRQGSGNKQEIQMKRNLAKLKQKERNKKKKHPKGNLNLPDPNKLKPKTLPSPTVFNKDGNLVYSKFDLSSSVITQDNTKNEQKSLKKTFKDLKRREKKVQKLEEEDSGKAEEFRNKHLWKQALNKAEGLKVKDNPELVKKSMKRREQRKKKSQKQWQVRTEQVQKKQDSKQDKRSRNIDGRKKDKLKHKLKRAVKKGRLIPGF